MEYNASPQRARRRMGGIPPLAPDLVPATTVMAAAHVVPDLPQADLSSAQAVAEAALVGPELQSSWGKTPAPMAPLPVAGRRMSGASTVPLAEGIASAVTPAPVVQELASSAAHTTREEFATVEQHTDAPAQVLGQSLTQTTNRRRLGGPSSAPLLVARAPEPHVASALTETGAVASAQDAQDGVSSMVPQTTRRRLATPSISVPETYQTTEAVATPSAEAPLETVEPPAETQIAAAPAPQSPPSLQPVPAVKRAPVKPSNPRKTAIRKRGIQLAVLVVVAFLVVLAAQWMRTLPSVTQFIGTYSGHSSHPQGMPEGIPRWLGWQHFLNMFFMVLIVRTGLQVRLERKPPGYWTAKKGSFFSPGKQAPKKISMTQWLHQSLDVLWVLNGLIFVIALLASGYWMRIVPTSWDVFPNMLSAGIQYLSLDWPDENGWIHYNALQVMAYFITVFLAAPLAIISGLRMSTWWPTNNEKLSKVYPVEIARAVHIPVMVYFMAFTVVHVFLVLFTGVMRNLNHMYTSRDIVDFWGLVIFIGSLILVAAGWFLTNQMFMRPVAGAMGKVSKN